MKFSAKAIFIQGIWVQPPVQEDPTCRGATKPVRQTTKPTSLRARALQQEKPLESEAPAPPRRAALARCNWRKPACSHDSPEQPEIK